MQSKEINKKTYYNVLNHPDGDFTDLVEFFQSKGIESKVIEGEAYKQDGTKMPDQYGLWIHSDDFKSDYDAGRAVMDYLRQKYPFEEVDSSCEVN